MLVVSVVLAFILVCIVPITINQIWCQWFASKIVGEYGVYAYAIKPHGWTAYKVNFSRKLKLGYLPLWGQGVSFGDTKDSLYSEEKLTPEEMKRWVQDSLKAYEKHLLTWGKVGATDKM